MITDQPSSGCAKNIDSRERNLIVCKAVDLSRINIWWHRHDSIYLRLPQLTDKANAIWENKIQQAYNECGCRFGAYSLGFALATLIIVFTSKIAQDNFDFYALARFSTISVVGSIVAGKLLGILTGRVYALFLIKRLQNFLAKIE